ncbi:Putative cytochrome bd menaquinol oxidase subunit II [Bacillus rhizoplanae]|uniref:Cytochrome bd menaquinol oxidase subunit II n=1 Tax=Bacillus rhizoplanae TaxID=2880966 RepID=A0ABM8Y8X3_9BACI|nr:cytochrome d ubiquinol oxidase subunit II [Bacillus rhizoplanae]CAG9612168.1 Putative cytochrome bd menaquinol oxidase subunit II [Bacillus rhizoplanae]
MPEASIAIIILWAVVFVYSILGSIDFGAGFWGMVYAKHPTLAGKLANRYLSPTWEVTNTFLVFVVVAFLGFFPKAAFTLATAMFLPVTLILILVTIRSTFMVFSYSLPKYQYLMRVISGITGLLIPALLITVLPVTEGAFITTAGGKETLLYGKLLSSPVVYWYMLFGLTSELFLSALFLADFAREQGSEDTYRVYRRNAIVLGPATLVTAIIALVVMEPETHWLMEGLIKQFKWFTISIIFFIIGYSSLWWTSQKHETLGWPRIAVLSVVAQYGFASYAYGVAHLPYIIYPEVTVFTSFTTKETFYALLILYAVGIAILLPGFIFFWNLFLKDRTFLK